MVTRAKWLLALGLLAGVRADGQELRFREYGRTDGLPSGHVFSVQQDAAGWIWVGGTQGLFRFDGYGFRQWGVAEGVPAGTIQAVVATPEGRVWAMGPEGVAVLPPGAKVFERVGVPLGLDRWLKAAAGKNQLYIVDGATLWILEPKAGSNEVQVGSVAAPGADAILQVAVDGQGTVWAVCGVGLYRLEDRAGKGRRLVLETATGLPAERWQWLASGPRGELAVRGTSTLWIREAGSAVFEASGEGVPVATPENVALTFAAEGELLVATARGLSVGRRENGRRHWRVIGTGNGLPTASVVAVTVDREGAVWLGMGSEPALVRWERRAQWESWSRAHGLDDQAIWGTARDGAGVLWAAGNGGLYRKDGDRFRAELAGEGEYFRHPVAAPDGSLWMIVNRDLVRRRAGGAQQDYRLPADSRLRCLLMDKSRRLWAIGNQVFRSDGDITSGAVHFSKMEPLGTEASEQFTQASLDQQGRVFLAGTNGLAIYDVQANRWQRLGVNDGLASLRLQAVLADSSGRVWASSRSPGPPVRLHFVNGRWQADRLSVPKDLEQAIVVSLAEDAEKKIWVGTENGVFAWNGADWRRYGTEDGMRSEDCVAGTLFVDQDHSIWTGTARGLARFAGDLTALRPLPPPGAAITDFAQEGSGAEFSLRSLSFWRQREQLFLYRVHGRRFYGTVFDSGWVEAREPDVIYASLPGGAYDVELKTRNAEQSWSEASGLRSFTVPVPWYGTVWFLGLLVVGVPLAARWWWKRQRVLATQKSEWEAARLERAVHLRTRALEEARERADEASRRKSELLAGMSEQIRRPLHGLNGSVELALASAKEDRQREYLESAQASAATLLAMVGEVLDYAEIESGKLSLRREPCEVRECVRSVALTLQATLHGHLSWQVADTVPVLVESDGQRLRQILLHLATSLLKSPGSEGVWLKVELEYTSSNAVVLVFGAYHPAQPAGVFSALDPEVMAGSDGMDLAIAARLIELMGGRLTARGSGGARSFRFSLRLPVWERETNGEQVRVLLAEQDVRNRRVTAMLLEQAGYPVATASGSGEVVSEASAYDALLIDTEAALFDALETTRRIRAEEAERGALARLRIVGLSTSDDGAPREQFLRAGMDAVLVKPVRLEHLREALRAVAAER